MIDNIDTVLLVIIAGILFINGLMLVIGITRILDMLTSIWETVMLGFSLIFEDTEPMDPPDKFPT